MATLVEIDALIEEIKTLRDRISQKSKMPLPITGKKVEVSLPQSDIDSIDTAIGTQKTKVQTMWKNIKW